MPAAEIAFRGIVSGTRCTKVLRVLAGGAARGGHCCGG